MFDFLQSLFCAFNPLDTNRAALITFASEVVVRIPIGVYNSAEWFQLVDQQRADNLCCSCCTPTASALNMAAQMIQQNPAAPGTLSISFMITDGQPYQKYVRKGKKNFQMALTCFIKVKMGCGLGLNIVKPNICIQSCLSKPIS